MTNLCTSSQFKICFATFQMICKHTLRFLMLRVIGPFLLAVANILLVTVKLGFILLYLPDFNGIFYWINLLIGTFIFVNVMFNYWFCAFSSPGYPPTCRELFSDPTSNTYRVVDGKQVKAIPSRLEILPGASYRYCRHCDCIKPPRAHHDSVSGKCVLHMDHYCPWMSNCIGFENYRYFVLFLFYMFIGCIYVIYITLHSMSVSKTNRLLMYGFDKDSITMLLCTVAFAVSISVGILLGIHSYLCISNQTTIELYINYDEYQDAKREGKVYKNPFDKGCRKNLMRVFGDVPWYKALSISFRKPGDLEFPLRITDYMQHNQYSTV